MDGEFIILVVIGLAAILLFVFRHYYSVDWIPESKSKTLKPSYRTVSCDCDHEMVCPQGRRPEETRCKIYLEDRS